MPIRGETIEVKYKGEIVDLDNSHDDAMLRGRIENKRVEHYKKYQKEPYRPPSKGGNTSALHSHVLIIDGEKYSFLALGGQQRAYKSDTVSFEYEITKEGYRNIIVETFVARTKDGAEIVRGNRGFKSRLRTAGTRMPASRRERLD